MRAAAGINAHPRPAASTGVPGSRGHPASVRASGAGNLLRIAIG
jgi:hypothetical protein